MKQLMRRLSLILLAVFLAGATTASAQRVRRSQLGSVTQTVSRTEITVTYSRPTARGRDLFGALVKYDEIWMPGANWATTIEFSEDVTIAGQKVPEGKYSIWTIPGELEWTFILSKKSRVYHTDYPKGQDAVRTTVTPESASHMETMAFYFPIVGADSATLYLHWGETVIPLTINTK